MLEYKFLHISDTHFSTDYKGELLSRLIERTKTVPQQNFIKILEAAKGRLSEIDFLVVTGDLANEGHPEQYRELKEIIHKHMPGVPACVCLGNHDNREEFYREFLGSKGSILLL